MIRFTLFNKMGMREKVKDMLLDDFETIKEYDIVMDLNNADLIICRKDETPKNTYYVGTIYPESYGKNRADVVGNILTYKAFDDGGYVDKFYKDLSDIVWEFKKNPCNFLTKTEVVNKYGKKYLLDVAFYQKFHTKSRQYNDKWFTPTVILYIKPIIEYYYEKDKKSKSEER